MRLKDEYRTVLEKITLHRLFRLVLQRKRAFPFPHSPVLFLITSRSQPTGELPQSIPPPNPLIPGEVKYSSENARAKLHLVK